MSDDEIDCHPTFFFMNIMMLFSLTKESDMIGNDIYSRSSIFWLYFIIMIYPTIFSSQNTLKINNLKTHLHNVQSISTFG